MDLRIFVDQAEIHIQYHTHCAFLTFLPNYKVGLIFYLRRGSSKHWTRDLWQLLQLDHMMITRPILLQWHRQVHGAYRRTLSGTSAISRRETQIEMKMDWKANNIHWTTSEVILYRVFCMDNTLCFKLKSYYRNPPRTIRPVG